MLQCSYAKKISTRRQEEILRQQQLAEQRRLEQEREERERKRQANERQQIKDRNLKEKMQKISLTTHGQRVLKKLDEEVFIASFKLQGEITSCSKIASCSDTMLDKHTFLYLSMINFHFIVKCVT